jgi:hypothetical protein
MTGDTETRSVGHEGPCGQKMNNFERTTVLLKSCLPSWTIFIVIKYVYI